LSYSVEIQPQARDDLREIVAFISEASPQSAERWLRNVTTAIQGLSEFPEAHPLARENGSHQREIRQMSHGKYRVIYFVDDDRVMVVSVRHSARLPHPPGSFDE